MSFLRNLWPWLAAAFSGGLLTLCFAPFDQSWLVWIALAPLLAALWFGPLHPRYPLLRKVELGYLTGLVYFLGSLHWITVLTIPGWFILCLYLALYPAVWAGIVFVIATPREDEQDPLRSVWLSSWHNLATAGIAAAAWVGLEILRGHIFTGFAWNSLGIALHGNIPLIQLSSLTGVGGLSFLAVLSSAIAVATVRRLMIEARGGKIRAHFDFTITIALIVVAFGYGLRQIGRPAEVIPLRVAAVQPSIPQNEKWNPAFEQRIYDTFERQTAVAAALQPDLLLWPEAATPRGFFEDRVANEFVNKWAAAGDHALLFGTLRLSHEADYNAAVLLTTSLCTGALTIVSELLGAGLQGLGPYLFAAVWMLAILVIFALIGREHGNTGSARGLARWTRCLRQGASVSFRHWQYSLLLLAVAAMAGGLLLLQLQAQRRRVGGRLRRNGGSAADSPGLLTQRRQYVDGPG
jgi:apolipoprotein N-acyltransferase